MYVGSPSIFVRVVVLNRAKMSSADTSGTFGMNVSIADTMTVAGANGLVVVVAAAVVAAGGVALGAGVGAAPGASAALAAVSAVRSAMQVARSESTIVEFFLL